MGRLIYTQDSSYDIDDRILAHLRVVMMNKLRRREGFMLQMPTTGGGRSSIWISPTRALLMQFYGGRALTPERLASALRQLPPASVEVPSTVAVGALLVDTDRHRVELYGTPITTTPREFDILLALATSHPRIVTLDELAHTHGGGTQRQASIRVMVAGLRSRFAALTGAPRDAVIETHRGIGYRLAA